MLLWWRWLLLLFRWGVLKGSDDAGWPLFLPLFFLLLLFFWLNLPFPIRWLLFFWNENTTS